MLVIKFLHVLVNFVWMGSLLTLTRLLGYLPREAANVQVASGRLYFRTYLFVDLPAMILSVGTGITLIFMKKIDFLAPWFHLKMTCAFFLILTDLVTGRAIYAVQGRPLKGSGAGFKILHYIAGVLLIGVLVAIYIMKAASN